MVVLTTAYILHVLSAALWTGGTLYVTYAVLPAARTGRLGADLFAEQLHRLLLLTRWTGVVLPITGAYLIWARYLPVEVLLETRRGWAVLSMLGLWGVMNGLIEAGVLQARRTVDDPGIGAYMQEGFPAELIPAGMETTDLLVPVRPYLLASTVCAVLLLADAALLASGV